MFPKLLDAIGHILGEKTFPLYNLMCVVKKVSVFYMK